MAFTTVILYRKGIFALVVAGTAGFALPHFCHGCFLYSSFVGKYLRVAVDALVVLQMVLMAECRFAGFRFESDSGGPKSLVALVAITGC